MEDDENRNQNNSNEKDKTKRLRKQLMYMKETKVHLGQTKTLIVENLSVKATIKMIKISRFQRSPNVVYRICDLTDFVALWFILRGDLFYI